MCSSALTAFHVGSVVPFDRAAGWRVTVGSGNQDRHENVEHYGITSVNFIVKMTDWYGNHINQNLTNLNMYCNNAY